MAKKKILLVEDDELMRQLYKDILSEDFTVQTASNGNDALVLLNNHSYDLILMDMLLPDMKGLEVIKKVAQNVLKKSKIVFLTNMDKSSLKDVTRLGYSFIIKSEYTPDTFGEKIKSLLI